MNDKPEMYNYSKKYNRLTKKFACNFKIKEKLKCSKSVF